MFSANFISYTVLMNRLFYFNVVVLSFLLFHSLSFAFWSPSLPKIYKQRFALMVCFFYLLFICTQLSLYKREYLLNEWSAFFPSDIEFFIAAQAAVPLSLIA